MHQSHMLINVITTMFDIVFAAEDVESATNAHQAVERRLSPVFAILYNMYWDHALNPVYVLRYPIICERVYSPPPSYFCDILYMCIRKVRQ